MASMTVKQVYGALATFLRDGGDGSVPFNVVLDPGDPSPERFAELSPGDILVTSEIKDYNHSVAVVVDFDD